MADPGDRRRQSSAEPAVVDRHARLTSAWTQDGGHVIALAPSAAAAAVLAEETGIRADTLAKLVWALEHAARGHFSPY